VRVGPPIPECHCGLSYFMMLSECWLDIQPHTSLLWYFYSSARYEHKVFSGIELMPQRNYRGEYRNVIIRAAGKAPLEGGFMLTWAPHHNGQINISFHH
jgi:hypothetical protein